MSNHVSNSWRVVGLEPTNLKPSHEGTCSTPLPVKAVFPEVINPEKFIWVYELTLKTKNLKGLIFESISPLCEISINGKPAYWANNAFHPHNIDLSILETAEVVITLTFSPYSEFIQRRNPRPKWKSAIANNNHRLLRNSLLGSITEWALSAPDIGILKSVEYLTKDAQMGASFVKPSVINGYPSIEIGLLQQVKIPNINSITVMNDGRPAKIRNVTIGDEKIEVTLDKVDLWWPHTHGKPVQHEFSIEIESSQGSFHISKTLAFKTIEIPDHCDPVFKVNNKEVFVRGSCWTPTCYETGVFDYEKTKRILELAQLTGINLIRISGPMRYEDDRFYELCDSLGILVWQDFAFANFDYPTDDEFTQSVEREIHYQVKRLTQFACIAVFCGNSEVQQQAAMTGHSLGNFKHPIFSIMAPQIVHSSAAGIPYIPSSPSGGLVPFQTNIGFSHYFGYGAYKKTEEDLKISDVKFASECLGLSHCPGDKFNLTFFGKKHPPTHLPKWKEGITRDSNTGWDFEDIRDHYFSVYFNEDPIYLRSVDLESYHKKSRVLTGYMLCQAFNWWRSTLSSCNGAITWWLNDISPGAGWGIIDSSAQMKPAAYVLKWQLQPTHLSIIPNSLSGHEISLVNELTIEIEGDLTVHCIQSNRNVIKETCLRVKLPPSSATTMNINEVFGHFVDSTYDYKFGPEAFDVVGVSFTSKQGITLSDVHFPRGLNLPIAFNAGDINIECKTTEIEGRTYLELTSDRTVTFADVVLKNATILDNYKTLLPNTPTHFQIIDFPTDQEIAGVIDGLNLGFRVRFQTRTPLQ